MAFDFDTVVPEDPGTVAAIQHRNTCNITNSKNNMTDAQPIGDNTGREYFESVGYFDAAAPFYMVDPDPYLQIRPDTVANFGVIKLEPGRRNNYFFTDDVLTKPQLVFQQVGVDVTPDGVVENPKGRALYVFKGIYRVTKDASGRYHLSKLWDKFIFNPQKQGKQN